MASAPVGGACFFRQKVWSALSLESQELRVVLSWSPCKWHRSCHTFSAESMTSLVPLVCCLDYHRSHYWMYDEVVSRPQVAPASFPQAKSPHRDCQALGAVPGNWLSRCGKGMGQYQSFSWVAFRWHRSSGPSTWGKPWLGAHCRSPMAEHLLADMSVPVSQKYKEKVRIENLIASRLRFKMWPFGVLGLWLSNSWGTTILFGAQCSPSYDKTLYLIIKLILSQSPSLRFVYWHLSLVPVVCSKGSKLSDCGLRVQIPSHFCRGDCGSFLNFLCQLKEAIFPFTDFLDSENSCGKYLNARGRQWG